MGTPTRLQPVTVNYISQKPWRYRFNQLLRMLECFGELKNYSMRPHPDLSFPAADVLALDNTKKEIVLRFMGLFGVDAPLPSYFLSEALRSTDKGENLRAFLNLFNHRLYELFYLAWKKNQPVVLLEQDNNQYLKFLMAISGNVLTIHDKREFAVAGILGRRVRSANGLKTMLQLFLSLNVTIQQFVPYWREIQNNNLVGKNFCLGESVIGERVLDLSSKILITIGVMSLSRALTLLPYQTAGQRLNALIRRYVEPYIQYRLCFMVQPEAHSILMLGSSCCSLGLQCWVGELPQNGPISFYC